MLGNSMNRTTPALLATALLASGGANPMFVTSDPNGGWSSGGYYVHNNMWNTAYNPGPETLYACSFHSWYVVSNQTNSAGAVVEQSTSMS